MKLISIDAELSGLQNVLFFVTKNQLIYVKSAKNANTARRTDKLYTRCVLVGERAKSAYFYYLLQHTAFVPAPPPQPRQREGICCGGVVL